ncbi:type II toxin-antitoxin system PemK/MazF family toxin [Maribellus sediminis]|uniref:type II toxin-antitoxin system PemK/MazF family toxin n=1 Tax=Maribellus sediminis TaxID=2696285 RepID=UPI0014305F6E|nr:type II toxin-antitoxin system PemK/MazF family toxin [Maribellus sediminis]
MKQCEIWLADLNPVKGSEQKGMRPVVILSGNVLNDYMPIVIVCPLTTKIKGYKGNLILEADSINKLSQQSEVLTFHIRSVSKERLIKKIGTITEKQLAELKQGLDDILRY